ncbi:MAG TPA: alpha/beta hydrolase, partial [Pyrinomonadaceae bacterium]|nr:alpha/beta hydrolase [Pyrinomonadaceae bacterium]
AESLKRQGKTTSAQMVEREFEKAWEKADTKLRVEDIAGTESNAVRPLDRNTPSLRFADVRLKTGVRLHYAEQGDPAGNPVVLLHGYGDSWFSYSRVLPLIGANHRVYVLDLRGHGDSDRPTSGYKFSDFAADVLAFMDAKGLKSATVVGHSMGSFVAQHVAVAAPDRVARLVLIGAATTPRNATVLGLQREVSALSDPIPEKFAREFQSGMVYQKVPDDFIDKLVAESLKPPARVWRAVMAGMLAGDARSQLARIKAPTLIMWGDRETVFSRAEQDALVKAIPTAVFKEYKDVGHGGPHWELPERFVQDLEEFIARSNLVTSSSSGPNSR